MLGKETSGCSERDKKIHLLNTPRDSNKKQDERDRQDKREKLLFYPAYHAHPVIFT